MLKNLTASTERYQEQLLSPEGEQHYEYLNVIRGLNHETILKFKLGAVLDASVSHEQASQMISIPYLTPAGTVQIRFRKAPWAGGGPKYWQTPGSLVRMYNTNMLLEGTGRIAYVCEGEFDTMAATQAGLPAVGISGVNGWRNHFYAMLAGFDRIAFLADSDGEGDKLKVRPDDWPEGKEFDPRGVGIKFAETHANAMEGGVVIQMPAGHDVNSYLVEEGVDALLTHAGFKPKAVPSLNTLSAPVLKESHA